jgi:hypothetical protein
MEPITLIVGAVILAAGFLTGRLTRATRSPQPDLTGCGCGHHLSYRDPDTGHCTEKVQEPTRYDGAGHPITFQMVPCPCRNHMPTDQLLLHLAIDPPTHLGQR